MATASWPGSSPTRSANGRLQAHINRESSPPRLLSFYLPTMPLECPTKAAQRSGLPGITSGLSACLVATWPALAAYWPMSPAAPPTHPLARRSSHAAHHPPLTRSGSPSPPGTWLLEARIPAALFSTSAACQWYDREHAGQLCTKTLAIMAPCRQ